MAGNFYINPTDLQRIKPLVFSAKVKKEVAKSVGQVAITLHSNIKQEVYRRYNVNQNLIDSAFKGLSVSTEKTGLNVISNGLEYSYKITGLGKFYSSWFMGNINSGKKHKGTVFNVSVKRGNVKIVHGREHRGGFIPMTQTGQLKRGGNNGYVMYERTSDKRYPLRVLYAPSVAHMVKNIMQNNKFVGNQMEVFKANLQNIISNVRI